MKIIVLAALGANNVIGNGDELIPPLVGDLKKFKDRTSEPNTLMVMGRTTFEGIPPISKKVVLDNGISETLNQIMPGRRIAVLTRNLSSTLKGEDLVEGGLEIKTDNVDDLIDYARRKGFDKLWVCGGSQVYKYFLDNNLVDEMILTMHHKEYEGDKLFPEIEKSKWAIAYRMPCFEGGFEVKYTRSSSDILSCAS